MEIIGNNVFNRLGKKGINLKALVTGGGGFLGYKIVEQLLDKKYTVRSISRSHYLDLENLN